MKSRIVLGILLLAGVSGEAAAQCDAGMQVQNTVLAGATQVVTFSNSGPNGSISIAGTTGTFTGNRTDIAIAEAFDSTNAGSTPANVPGAFAFAGNYANWNAGDNGGTASITYTSTTSALCSALDISTTFAATGAGVLPTKGTCTNGAGSTGALTTLLSLSLVCGRPGASYPGGTGSADRWQEQHRAGSQLWDYKQGTSTVDPTKQVGTWSIAGTGASSTVTHNYGSSSFTWTVHNNGTHYSFCTGVGGAEHVRAFITIPVTLATASCGSYPLPAPP